MTFTDQFLRRWYSNPTRLQALCAIEPLDEPSRQWLAAFTAEKCECGSGSNERSGAHSHWCRLWVAP